VFKAMVDDGNGNVVEKWFCTRCCKESEENSEYHNANKCSSGLAEEDPRNQTSDQPRGHVNRMAAKGKHKWLVNIGSTGGNGKKALHKRDPPSDESDSDSGFDNEEAVAEEYSLTRVSALGKAGSHLTIDGSGAYNSLARSGETQAFIFTDAKTSYRSARPTKNKTCLTLLNEVKLWIAHVGHKPESVHLRSIHTDNEFMCEPLCTWCKENGIKLTSCTPHTHQQNAIAETSVKMIKSVVRKNEVSAHTGAKLRALCYKYSAHQLNRTPSSTDITGHMRSPGARWPNAPFYHPSQQLHPWGCLVHGFVGKRSQDPNSAPRAHPGIFV
jgi:hypothetical protein